MKFSEYMGDWLYGENGYYSNYKTIGKEGDFYTAVSTSQFFGGCIAKHIISLVDEGFLNEDAVICEIGAHHGYFLADVVQFIYTLRPALLDTFEFIIPFRQDSPQLGKDRKPKASVSEANTPLHPLREAQITD